MDYEVPDKLGWRVRLKSTPTGRYWFRLAVAIFGFALIIAAPLTGWLPGPGGIPLFLAGLAVLSSEFLWAKSVNRWLLRYVRVYVCWPVNQRRFFWVAVVGVAGLLWWASLAIIGKSLNHQSQQTTAIYARLDLDPVRAAVNTATAAMMEAAGLRKPAEVKNMPKRNNSA